MATVYTHDMAVLLQEAFKVSNAVDVLNEQGLLVVSDDDLSQLFFKYILREIAKRALVYPTYVHCAHYAAQCCADLVHNPPKYETVFEYLRDARSIQSPDLLRQGANLCFLMVTLFPGRLRRRSLDRDYYVANGRGFYFSWHSKSESPREIGLHMSEHFKFISDVTMCGLHALRAPYPT